MNTLILLSGLAGIIQLIVVIILIAKFFQLTSSVKEINSKLLQPKDDNEEYELFLISGKWEKVYEILIDKISKKIREAYYDFDESYYTKEFDKIVRIYKPKFELIQKEIPSYILKYKDREILKNIIN